LTKEIAQSFARRGMIADYAIHAPDKEGDERNTHAHFITTLREVKDGEFGNKNREWNDKEYLKDIRADVCGITNKYLEKYGIQVDHRSYEEQGIDKEPTQHKGVNLVAHERRLKRISKELKKKESEAMREMIEAVGDMQLEQNKKKFQQPEESMEKEQWLKELDRISTDKTLSAQQKWDQTKIAMRTPEPPAPQPKTKEELFVNICYDNKTLIGNHLLAEAMDLGKRNKKMQNGGGDENFTSDKRINEAAMKMYAEVSEAARNVEDYPKWKALHDSLYNDPDTKRPYQNFTYSTQRYQLWEKIRQPFLKMSKELFPEEKKQEKTQTQGRKR